MLGDEGDVGTKASLLAALASELVWADDGDRRFALSDAAVDDGTPGRTTLVRSHGFSACAT